jgi:hypothetical protein
MFFMEMMAGDRKHQAVFTKSVPIAVADGSVTFANPDPTSNEEV